MAGAPPLSNLNEDHAARPALPNEAMHFMGYDTAMMTTMGCVADGRARWRIRLYESGEPFELEGEIPAEFHRLYAKAKDEQDGDGGKVDHLYEVTADLAWD